MFATLASYVGSFRDQATAEAHARDLMLRLRAQYAQSSRQLLGVPSIKRAQP